MSTENTTTAPETTAEPVEEPTETTTTAPETTAEPVSVNKGGFH